MPSLIPTEKLLFGGITLFSPLSAAECTRRVAAAVCSPNSSLSGSVRDNWFRVAWRPGTQFVRNSFKPHLVCTLQDANGGTIARCRLTLHPLVMLLLAPIACLSAVAAMMHNWHFALTTVSILLTGVGLSWGERELLVYDVASAINARPEA